MEPKYSFRPTPLPSSAHSATQVASSGQPLHRAQKIALPTQRNSARQDGPELDPSQSVQLMAARPPAHMFVSYTNNKLEPGIRVGAHRPSFPTNFSIRSAATASILNDSPFSALDRRRRRSHLQLFANQSVVLFSDLITVPLYHGVFLASLWEFFLSFFFFLQIICLVEETCLSVLYCIVFVGEILVP